jgi:hypothetical protein
LPKWKERPIGERFAYTNSQTADDENDDDDDED